MELKQPVLVSAIAVTLKQMSEGTPLTVWWSWVSLEPSPSSHHLPAPSPATYTPASSQPCCSLPALLAHRVSSKPTHTCSERPGLQECL